MNRHQVRLGKCYCMQFVCHNSVYVSDKSHLICRKYC